MLYVIAENKTNKQSKNLQSGINLQSNELVSVW